MEGCHNHVCVGSTIRLYLHGLRLHEAKEEKTKFAKDSRYWQQPLLFHVQTDFACGISLPYGFSG